MVGASPIEVRVILLGRTGFDAVLRLDPAVELVRTRSALEAIGELSQPAEGTAKSVVLVASKVEGLMDDGPRNESRIADFVSALRLADPAVCVLGVRNGQAPPPAFDGGIAHDASPEELRRVIRHRSPRETKPENGAAPRLEKPAPVQVSPEAVLIEPMFAAPRADAAPPAGKAAGDAALVTMLLRGQEILPAAVGLIRERTGDAGVEFVPTGQPGGGPIEVSWEGVAFGTLRAASCNPALLGPHARWLAGWLRLRDQQSQLRTAAFTDSLTGAWNRRYFDRFIVSAIEQAKQSRRHLTVLFFDIDDFKKYNDLYGHEAGDDILRETMRLLRSVIRPTDRVCRVGGDEFAVIFHEPEGPRLEGSRHPASVFAIAQRFQQQVLNHQFPKLLNCAPGTLTISGGLATFPWDGATPAALLARADQLSIQSKRAGKNAITIGPGALRLLDQQDA